MGYGNLYVTPDALGPKVVQNIDITRHILTYLPEVLDKDTRPVSAISPGVLGTTGIETIEILKGIIDNIHPKLLIVIDSLCSRSIDRISSTVQISDTGIVPGAGVGNTRKELSIETLGIPVVAIGVPTVVEAATIAADSLDLFAEKFENERRNENENKNKNKNENEKNKKTNVTKLKQIKEEDKYTIIKEIFLKKGYNFIVTPKEIDDLIDNMSNIIARGINLSI